MILRNWFYVVTLHYLNGLFCVFINLIICPLMGIGFVSVVIVSAHKIHVTKAMSLEGFGTALKQL